MMPKPQSPNSTVRSSSFDTATWLFHWDRVAGQRPVTGFDARRVEDHDFAPVEGHVTYQVAVSLVRAVELREPGVDVGIGDGHLVAVEFQHDVFALARA